MTSTDNPIIAMHAAARKLSGTCDGARSRDDHGFNRFDADFGKRMAALPPDQWTAKQATAMYKTLHKYRAQLGNLGIDFSAIQVPEEWKEEKPKPKPEELDINKVLEALPWGKPREVPTRNGKRTVREAELVEAHDFWAIWRTQGGKIKQMGYSVNKFNGNWQVAHWTTPPGQKDEPIELAPTKPKEPEVLPDIEIPEDVAKRLLPHQVPSAKRIAASLNYFGAAVDGSDLGSGKTYTALGVCRVLGLRPVIICPKAVINSWRRAAAHMEIGLYCVLNYELVRRGKTPIGKWTEIATVLKNGKTKTDLVFEWRAPANALIIFDEAHKMKTADSQNCKLGLGALRQNIKTLAISGTIAANPTEMRFVGEVCRLHKGKDFYPWMLNNGCSKGRFGLQFIGGSRAMAKIHQAIYPKHGDRVRIVDIPGFPECQTTAEAFDCASADKINAVYDEMFAELAKVQAREDLSPGARQGQILAVMMYARQRAEMLKVPSIIEMAEDHMENGRSVVIFTNFKETVDVISEKMITNCYVDGRQAGEAGARTRQANIDAFQADKERLIIVNIQSGGAGLSLHDLNGRFPRTSIICPTWSAQDLLQSTGRIHRAGGKSKAIQIIFFAAGTIEENVCEKVRGKIKNITALNDGDLSPDSLF